MDEQWRDVAGYEGLYSVSNLGRVRGRTGAILKGSRAAGYRSLRLCKVVRGRATTKDVYVHDLVLDAFVGPKPANSEVRHGPAGKLNNSVENLCYGSRSENQRDRERDGTMDRRGRGRPTQPDQRKLTNTEAAAMRRDRLAGETYRALSKRYSLSVSGVWGIVNKRRYKDVA